ncbi:inorganic diphosphatase [Chitinophaga silvatica]|uniref:inorganic diphosphatase n=1 Tax=Chitinophaga silvatica TaxID=2282649 RepID=A0A3E1YH11_9BACT|nr:inorganic diphosphatase [Chitinophaga silvatica]RFS26644.1 inorganic diphosphatase [Chitinophaga silvatica]
MKIMKAIIETPKGSSMKYDYNPEIHLFELSKILPAGMVFPYDFGFIPETKGEDGDPLDVIIISEFHSFTGCVLPCRIIGAIEAQQSTHRKGKEVFIRNDRYIAIPVSSSIFEKVKNITDLPKKIMFELAMFFEDYNKIEDKMFIPQANIKSKKAIKEILKNKKLEMNIK